MSDGEKRPKTYRVEKVDEADLEAVMNRMADEGYSFVQKARTGCYRWMVTFIRREIF